MSGLRKSAYGRTQLFLPTTGTILREVKCVGGIARVRAPCVYHPLETRAACCWHCCEPLDREPMPIPRLYDAVEGAYYVYGATCSPECAKAYILEHSSFDRAAQLTTFARMLRDVYAVVDAVTETPPRSCLRRFGGPFEPRGARVLCRVSEPPFVSYCMVVEEHAPPETVTPPPVVEEADTFDEPPPEGMYDAFLVEDGAPTPAPPRAVRPAPPSRAAKRASKGGGAGSMSKFVRRD